MIERNKVIAHYPEALLRVRRATFYSSICRYYRLRARAYAYARTRGARVANRAELLNNKVHLRGSPRVCFASRYVMSEVAKGTRWSARWIMRPRPRSRDKFALSFYTRRCINTIFSHDSWTS